MEIADNRLSPKTEQVEATNKPAYDSMLGTKSIPLLYLRFALAGIMANAILGVVAVVDGYFVSGFRELEVEGIGIGFTIMVITRMLGVLFGVGAGAVISLRLGKGKIEEARGIMGQTLWFTLFFSILLAVLGLVFENQIMTLFGASDEALPYAVQYSRLLWISLPLTILAVVLSILTNIDEKPVLSMSSWLVAAVVAGIIEWIMVAKYDMGMMGSSWANTISQSIPVLLIFYFWFGKTKLKPKIKDMIINLKTIGEVTWTGFASFSSQFMMFFAIIFFNNLLQSYGGGLHVAAFTIQNGYITNLLALVALGGMTGLQPIISYNYGAGNFDRVKQAIKIGLIFTVAFFVIVTAILIIFADPIVSFFSSGNPELQQLGIWTTIVFNSLFTLNAVSLLISGYFESQERNWSATFINVSKMLLFTFPFMFIFPKYWGVDGLWYSTPASEIPGVLVAIYFIRKEFKHLKETKLA
ncbi:MATE family efflux transporter [Aneurinibacillus aneurinilyticus]|jgi:putative MATE family efflux protein|uniref:MATE family efflux transporter n=1 Tax=Aneurinibacillus aneurinilyticus TaxID=1391 RepID=UPI0023F3D1C6|nr:MATE family efflux transporter [Aneurinibacillus aneurinilyticus]MCI1696836.1 MATE family efflux transporter [Aneurinibacillus aneurinilyticus]MED0668904.1 MATE family efflux transporter [Aneurinibacillus aneurinilyticus]